MGWWERAIPDPGKDDFSRRGALLKKKKGSEVVHRREGAADCWGRRPRRGRNYRLASVAGVGGKKNIQERVRRPRAGLSGKQARKDKKRHVGGLGSCG